MKCNKCNKKIKGQQEETHHKIESKEISGTVTDKSWKLILCDECYRNFDDKIKEYMAKDF